MIMTNEDYHADKSRIGSTGLKLLAKKTPAHYYAEFLDPNRIRKESTPAMKFGSLIHTTVLEPELVLDKYIVKPDNIDRRTTAGKQAFAEFEIQAAGREIITAEDLKVSQLVAHSITKHPAAKKLLSGYGLAEHTVQFIHPETGSHGKARLDFYNKDLNVIVDIKTTDDASPGAFARSVFNYMYHLQAAWYLDAVMHAENNTPSAFFFVAVEKEIPYAVNVYELSARDIALGRVTYLKHLKIYEECLKTNEWPAYGKTINQLTLPEWAHKQSLILDEEF